MKRSAQTALLALLVSSTGCSGEGGDSVEGHHLVHAETALIDGAFSSPDHDAGVLVQYDFNGQGSFTYCSGVLIAPNLVATARHCVADWEKQPFACDVQGQTVGDGGVFGGEEFDPTNIKIYVGNEKHLLVGGVPSATGVEVFDDGGPNLCSNDMAFVLLDKSIEDVPLFPLRLAEPARVGEEITVVGWGDTDGSTIDFEIQRTFLGGLEIEEVAAHEPVEGASGLGLPPKNFSTGPGICQGDSGGPALGDTGAIIGIAANYVGVNGDVGTDVCALATTTSIFMQINAYEETLREAYAAAGQPIWEEGHAYPGTVASGEACLADLDCEAGLCREETNGLFCAFACSADSDCASDEICDLGSDGGYCLAQDLAEEDGGSSGCSIREPRQDRHGAWFALGLLGLGLARRRRR